MTIEIKQLVIRAVVDGGRERASAPASSPAAVMPWVGATSIRNETHGPVPAEQREAIVAACVREVLRKLERSRER